MKATVTKNELVNRMAEALNVKADAVLPMVNEFMSQVTKAVVAGEKVCLRKFGHFYAYQKQAKRGHNFQTGETIDMPGHRAPKFKPSMTFKKAVSDDQE